METAAPERGGKPSRTQIRRQQRRAAALAAAAPPTAAPPASSTLTTPPQLVAQPSLQPSREELRKRLLAAREARRRAGDGTGNGAGTGTSRPQPACTEKQLQRFLNCVGTDMNPDTLPPKTRESMAQLERDLVDCNCDMELYCAKQGLDPSLAPIIDAAAHKMMDKGMSMSSVLPGTVREIAALFQSSGGTAVTAAAAAAAAAGR